MNRKLFAGGVGLVLLIGAWGTAPGARLVDIYPHEGMVKPRQQTHIEVEVDRPWYDFRQATVTITAGLSQVPLATLRTRGGTVQWTPPASGGYGITVRLGGQQVSSALDVSDNWAQKPRYGFLTDFGSEHAGQAGRFWTMAKFHLNGLQFYDWMYRHSDYLPPGREYRDPLGRLLSRDVLLEKSDLAQRHGMATMAYDRWFDRCDQGRARIEDCAV